MDGLAKQRLKGVFKGRSVIVVGLEFGEFSVNAPSPLKKLPICTFFLVLVAHNVPHMNYLRQENHYSNIWRQICGMPHHTDE